MPTLISPIDIISRSWENLRTHYKAYAEFVVLLVAVGLVQWTLGVILRAVVDDRYLRLTTYVIASVPAVLMYTVIGGGMIDFTVRTLTGKKAVVRDSLLVGAHLMLSLLWVSLLTTLAVMLGLFLLVIPAIIAFVWYKFASYHLVVDGIKGTGALTSSRSLVSGRWWAVLWRLLVPIVFFTMANRFAIAVLYLVIGAVLGDPRLFFSNIADIDQMSNLDTFVTTVIPQAVQGFFLALFLGADIALWLDLRKRRSSS